MLLLDAGNSSIKAQWWHDKALQYTFSARYAPGLQSRFVAFLADIKGSHCYYSSVLIDALESDLLTSLRQCLPAANIHRITPLASCHGVRNAYQPAEGIGVDRWLCLLGAAALTYKDVMIVDAGSAITIDLLRRDGQHLGGAILPGFNTTMERFKAILHRADFEHPDINKNDEPGSSTEACIHIDYGPTDIAVVERLIDRWFERLAKDAALIVTGGDAKYRKGDRYKHFRIVPDLVFQGMRQQLENQQ